MIPGFAITTQVATENMFNAVFASESEDGTPTTQCHGRNELVWRTVTFCICFFFGFVFMKQFQEHRLFHDVVSFGLVAGWLFAISNFPLMCWVNPNHPLLEVQSRNITLARFMITTVVNNLATYLEREKPTRIVSFFYMIERMLPNWMYDTSCKNSNTKNDNGGNAVPIGGTSSSTETEGASVKLELSRDEENQELIPPQSVTPFFPTIKRNTHR
jgi:hypothetical protein